MFNFWQAVTTTLLILLLSASVAVAAPPARKALPDAVIQIKLKDLFSILLPRTSEALPGDLRALLATIEARLAAIELLLRSLVAPTPLPPVAPPPAGALGTP